MGGKAELPEDRHSTSATRTRALAYVHDRTSSLLGPSVVPTVGVLGWGSATMHRGEASRRHVVYLLLVTPAAARDSGRVDTSQEPPCSESIIPERGAGHLLILPATRACAEASCGVAWWVMGSMRAVTEVITYGDVLCPEVGVHAGIALRTSRRHAPARATSLGFGE